jgi:D-alanine-D-alanine ligase
VADLESHLPAEWWRELFDSLYLRTDGDVVENDANTRSEVDLLLSATGLSVQDRILDLCCGQGRHALELARRGFRQVEGLDRSRYLIRLARRRAAKANLPVIFHEGDARTFRLRDGAFDAVVMMGNSFGYFEAAEDDARVFTAVKRVLRSYGTLVLDVTDGEWMRTHFEPRSWEWIDQNHFVCRERSLSADGQRLISREVVTHAERGVIADQFNGERLYSRDQIRSLLERAGFRNVRLHDAIVAGSERNQDLGMMARRLFLSATAPLKEPVRRRRTRLKVDVVMGDPGLPDMVKKNGQYNPEDFDTINRLKAALGSLPEYEFRYLDNHVTLETELKAAPPDLVFNLCDEGFNNDAFLELHVPALLEILGLPYTGAGPACLAMCYDKALVRAVAMTLEVPVPLETFVRPDDQSATLPSTFPALLKPNFGDSSLGITKDAVVRSPRDLVSYLSGLRETLAGRPVLVQEFLDGPEYSVSLLGNPETELRVLPILEVDYSGLDPALPKILGYESKWLPESPYWTQIKHKPTEADPALQRNLVEYSTALFARLRCRDYARFDFRTGSDGEVKLLEVNPNPGWCWDGKLNFMAGFAGLSYADLLRSILEAARERLSLAKPAVQRAARRAAA